MGTATGVEVHDAPRAIATDADDIEVIVDARPAPAQGIGGVTLADIWGGLLRYKPVAAAVAVLLIAAVVLPGAVVLSDGGFGAPSPTTTRTPLAAAGGPGAGTDNGTDTGVGADGSDTSLPGVAALVDAAATSDFAAIVATAPSTPSASTPSTQATSSSNAASADTPAAPPTTVASPTAVALAPTYTVREGGWATAQSTSPLATAGIPEGGLPVGKRLGDLDKLSFVRLAGASNALVLKVSDATGANRFTDQAKVQACRILASTWQAQPGQSLEQAPPYDRNACAVGAVQADGTWRFDLSGFKDAADTKGFALVPAADAGTDFQLVFQPS